MVLRSIRRLAVAAACFGLLVPLDAAAQARDIVVGQVAPFSGPQAVTGRAINAGIRLYLDQVNAEGGVNGTPIRLVTRDDAQKADESVRLVRELIGEESPVALIGTVSTASNEALIADGILASSGVPMIGAVSGASSVIQGNNMFVIKASYHDEVKRLFESLASLGMKRVGLVYQDDAFGADIIAGAQAASAQTNVELTSQIGYERNTTNVESAVAAMIEAKPQVVFLGATTAAAIEFVRQYRDAGGDATIYGLSVIDTTQLLNRLGPEGARGYAFTVVLPLESQGTIGVNREYLRLREKSQDPDLSARSIEGFIAAKTLVHAIKAASNGGAPSPAAVARALRASGQVDLGGYVIDFSTPGRPGSAFVDFAMFGDGGKIFR
ncbi:MAG: ABC transporter substrate-binding protein [Rhodocyclaceae bacterium]